MAISLSRFSLNLQTSQIKEAMKRNPFSIEIGSRDELRAVQVALSFIDGIREIIGVSYPFVLCVFMRGRRLPLHYSPGSFKEYSPREYDLGVRYTFPHFVSAFEGILFPKKRKEVKTIMKNVVEVKIKRDGEQQLLSIEILDKDLAKLFENEDTETSEKYVDVDGEGLEFYSLKDKLSRLSRKFNETEAQGRPITLRKYGSSLVSEEEGEKKFNLSILRSVDIEDGVTVDLDGLILKEDFAAWSESLANFVNFAYQEFVVERDREVKATVTIEY